MSDPSKHRAPTSRASRSLVRTAVSSAIAVAVIGLGVAATQIDRPLSQASDTAASSLARAALGPQPQQVVEGAQLELTRAAELAIKRAEEQRRARLAAIAARKKAERIAAKQAAQPFTIRVASFNVLGSNHTAPGGERPAYPVAGVRTPQAAGVINGHGTELVGLQEVKPDQLSTLTRMTGMVAWPGAGAADPDNSVMWDPSRFELVEGSTFSITFMSRARPQTVVRLRDRATQREFYLVNMHPSAGHDPRNTSTRVAGWDTGAATVRELRESGLPVLVTGDMNDRAAFFCRFLPPTGFVAAVGGSTSGGCNPPARMPVDWVVGSPDVTFSDYVIDESTVNRRISDHFYISATASVAPAGDG